MRARLEVTQTKAQNAPDTSALAGLDQLITTAVVFLAVFLLGRFFAGRVQLPFSNPDGIVGTLTQIRYNPANNLVRFLLITLLPTIALSAFFLMAPGGLVSRLFPSAPAEVSDKWRRTSAWRWFLPTALIITTLLVALDTPSYMSAGSFNAFEEGLPLSAGMSYLSGGTPFRDFIFTHGLYDEPLRIAFAFKLFGPSIGAMRTLQSINKIVTFGLLAWFLIRLFRGSAVWSLFTLFVLYWLEPAGELLPLNRAGLPSLHSVMIIPRDMSLFAFLVMLTFLADKIRRRKSADNGIFWIAMIWSAVPGLGYIHSMERGIYLFVAYAVIMPASYFLFFRGGPAARRFLMGCVLGIFLSALLLTVLIRGAFVELVQLTAFLASNDIQLQFGYPYRVLERPETLIGLIMAFSCFWIFRMFFIYWRAANDFVEGLRDFLRKHFLEAALLLISMLYYRNALGRSDWIHVAYVLSIPMILFLSVAIQHVFVPLSRKIAVKEFGWLKTAFAALFWIAVAGQGFILLDNLWRKDLLRENFPLTNDDSRYLPAKWKSIVSFLRQNLSPEERFYTLSDELSIYYFVGKPCPVRFPLLDMVAKNEQYQREIITDLEIHNVKYVVVDPKSFYFQIDGYSNELRAPLVFEYVRAHYEQYLNIDGQLIFARRSG